MLNFRRLKRDFSSAILRKGKELYEKSSVLSARILEIDGETTRIAGSISGNFENEHECELEIDRADSELVDSNCDCAYQFDCQHLAALLFYLEEHLESLIVTFQPTEGSSSLAKAPSDEEQLEQQAVIEEVQREASEKLGKKVQQQVLHEAIHAIEWLSHSSLFVAQEKIEPTLAELLLVLSPKGSKYEGREGFTEIQLALRLPQRSKPLHVPDLVDFLNRVRDGETLSIGGRPYFYTVDSFSGPSRLVIDHLLMSVQPLNESGGRSGLLSNTVLGMMIASLYEYVVQEAKGEPLPDRFICPCFCLGALDQPLFSSSQRAVLRFALKTLELPSPKLCLNPKLILQGEEQSLETIALFDGPKPGLLHEGVYFRFASPVRSRHLQDLPGLRDLVIPEPLFGTFAENALPDLRKIGTLEGEELVEGLPTLPYSGPVQGRCTIQYLDGVLEAQLSVFYGEAEIPATAAGLSYEHLESFRKDGSILARNVVEEKRLLDALFTGFQYRPSDGVFVAKTEKKIVEFMTEVIPRYQEQVDFECPENLRDQFIYDDSTFELNLSELDRVDAYSAELKVMGPLKGLTLDKLWEVVSSRRSFLELRSPVERGAKGRGSRSKKKGNKILVLDLERLHPTIQLLDEMGIRNLNDAIVELPLWSLATLAGVDRENYPIQVTFSKKLQEIQAQMLGEQPMERSPVPATISAELRCYQREGVAWLERLRTMHLNGILADDMGLGKTLQAIIAMAQYHADHPDDQSLIVCPTSLLYNWYEECRKFYPSASCMVIDGTPAQRARLLAESGDKQLLITSYSLLQKDIAQYKKKTFGYAILDEAQAIKNRGTRNARSAKQLAAHHRLVLTGTPVENSLEELWSLFDFLMRGLLSTYERFVERYCRSGTTPMEESLQGLRRKVAPFILRRMKRDVLKELPPVSEIVYYCHLSPVQQALYHSYATSAREELSRLVEREGFERVQIHVLATLTRLKQICCHPAIFAKEHAEEGDSAKYEMLMELLHSLIQGQHKIVLFSQYTQMLKIMREDLERLGIRFSYLDGSSKNRLALVEEFNRDPHIWVFLISLKAGGTGLNLVGADTVILYDPWWNPAVEAQATDRVHRIGQERKVSSYKLVTKGTIEEKILELQRRKEGLVREVISCDEEVISKLTWEEVLQLLEVDTPASTRKERSSQAQVAT